MGGLLNRLSILIMIILFISFFVVNAQTLPLPFIRVASISPSQPEVFDIVTVTVTVVPKPNVAVLLVWWSFGDSNRIETYPLNTTSHVEYSVHHLYGSPGTYYLSVGLRDAANQTAGDVQKVTVERETTTLTLGAVVHGESGSGYFTLRAGLLNGHGLPLNGSSVDFWYGTDGLNWLKVATSRTDMNGMTESFFNPVVQDADYQFHITYAGDVLRKPSDGTYIVKRVSSVVSLNATSTHLNDATDDETILLQACLTRANDTAPLSQMPIDFQYRLNGTGDWGDMGYGITRNDGCLLLLFKPPNGGNYDFKAVFSGDLAFTASENYIADEYVLPEFNSISIVIFACLAILLVAPRRPIF